MKYSRNTYHKGMDKDTSKTKYQSETYLDAKNIRIITQDGLSNYSVENIKGNTFSLTIPPVSSIYSFTDITKRKIDVIGTKPPLFLKFEDGTNTETVTIGSSPTLSQIETVLKTNPNLNKFNLIVISSVTDLVTYSHISLNLKVTLIEQGEPDKELDKIASKLTNPIVIGWTTIRDDIYLFTTENTSDTGGPGQIWKLTYDVISLAPTIELKYANQLGFTTKHPIEAIGRYENKTTQRLYWTDFFNAFRSINIADENAFITSIDNIDIIPSVSFSKPVLSKILLGGSLDAGMYQYAYRLEDNNGKQTQFSPLSNLIHIVLGDEQSENYWKLNDEYNGTSPGTVTNKSIEISIKNIDTDYKTIEVAAIKYLSSDTPSDIILIDKKEIGNFNEETFIHSGNEQNVVSITIEEFLGFNVPFTHCKTIASKDNILFAANVKTSKFHTIKFDARAYRYNSSGTTYVSDDTENQSDNDSINPNQNTFKFKKDGVTLGGDGPNVSYSFILKDLEPIDKNSNLILDKNRSTSPITTLILGQDVINLNTWFDYKSPYIHGSLKGYARGEIYRFGVTLFDKRGRAGFVNWIGDIKFPDFEDINLGTSYQLMIGEKLRILGIKFDIKIPADIIDLIGGYSIVRVSRNISDSSRLGTALLFQTQPIEYNFEGIGTGDTDLVYTLMREDSDTFEFGSSTGGQHELLAEDWDDTNNKTKKRFYTIDSPDIHFNKISSSDIDKIKCIARLGVGSSKSPAPESSVLHMTNVLSSNNLSEVNIDFSTKVSKGSSIQSSILPSDSRTNGTPRFINYSTNVTLIDGNSFGSSYNFNGVFSHAADSVGSDTMVIIPNQHIPIENNLNTIAPSRDMVLVSLIRNIIEQYGGNTAIQRDKNIYVTCGHYRPSNSISSTFDPQEVWGGDVYLTMYGYTKLEKNWGQGEFGAAPEEKTLIAYSFPCETVLNTDLRTGVHALNKDYPDDGTQLHDEFLLSDLYNKGDVLLKFFVKPELITLEEEFDTRIHFSGKKFNGENIDQWSIFQPLDFRDIESLYGPINKLLTFNDNMYFWQDRSTGMLLINPVSVIQDSDSTSLVLGSGTTIHDYKYLSNESGSKHQWGITKSDRAIYWYDTLSKKIYRISSEGMIEISDIKGIRSFMSKALLGKINDIDHNSSFLRGDNPIEGIGVSSSYDYRFNEALFTFKDQYDATITLAGDNNEIKLNDASSFEIGDSITFKLQSGIILETKIKDKSGNTLIIDDLLSFKTADSEESISLFEQSITVFREFTLAYNENIGAFSSFYSFLPPIYINTKDKLITPDPNKQTNLFIHNIGNYGEFYKTIYPSDITYIINPDPDVTKIFHNYEFNLQSSKDGKDDSSDTISSVRSYNEYQDSGEVFLIPDENIKRRMRTWRLYVPREVENRMRNQYLFTTLKYNNDNNKRIVLNDLITGYSITPL